jgi:hypothetical protein
MNDAGETLFQSDPNVNPPTNQKNVTEMKLIYNSGIKYKGRIFEVKIKGFISDAPCKAEASSIIPFNDFYGCGKCVTKGEYIHNICFPNINEEEITDESFRTRLQIKHNKKKGRFLKNFPSIWSMIFHRSPCMSFTLN